MCFFSNATDVDDEDDVCRLWSPSVYKSEAFTKFLAVEGFELQTKFIKLHF